MMFDDVDLNAIQDKNARELIQKLLNMIEQISADLRCTPRKAWRFFQGERA